MKIFLILCLFLVSSISKGATAKVNCFIDVPCGWLEPIPGVLENDLGFCVDGIEGDQNKLFVLRSDGSGNSLPNIEITVSELSAEKIAASNEDESVTLNASKYDDYLAGGLLFKTKEAPDGLGFFLTCTQNLN